MPLTISDPNVTTFCDSKSTCSGHTAHAAASSVARVSAIKAGEAILVMTVRCFSFVFFRICQSMFLRDPFSHQIWSCISVKCPGCLQSKALAMEKAITAHVCVTRKDGWAQHAPMVCFSEFSTSHMGHSQRLDF